MSDWQERAAGAGKPVEWFMSERGSRKDMQPQERRALALCATCPVANECLAYVLVNDPYEFTIRGAAAPPWAPDGVSPERVVHRLHGIWGGTTAQDRHDTRHLEPEERIKALRQTSELRARRLGPVKEDVA